ncbi:hypothetical protein [Bradyrhizobium vignae]|uniref:Uncharacterized protein n=1 Tax=Bradyrhizobium vignae TaxID=1549949 RepID=A0A2U3PUK3_9BRAD|nr:hypothetical protein [Bradyrhizobium vignae]SPP92840.1 protein of unknown function [Bradyrhizobium vignae]
MSLILELPQELAEPLESKATELNVDPSRFVAALVREKLRLPVKVGELEVYAPADILDYELEREPGETDEEYEANKATLGAVFRASLR